MKLQDRLTPSENTALEFEALICEVSALSIEVESMKVANKERELRGESLAYPELAFIESAKYMAKFAEKLRALKR